jgi:putative molybdopterin biosynthesis protein
LRQILSGQPWQQALAAMAGYTPSDSGQVLPLRQMLPWWDFKRKKRL